MSEKAEPWYDRVDREAAERVAALLALPDGDKDNPSDYGTYFDPWELFPHLYGSYSSDFDECAIEVLSELRDGTKVRHDLGAEMFREMLCNLYLCDYGTSPRVCFPTPQFAKLLPDLILRWKRHYANQWDAEYA